MGDMRRISVGVAGLGRSGWDIHCRILESLPEKYRVAGVFEALDGRRREAAARFGCPAYDKYDDLLANDEIELVAVALPSNMHAPMTIAALKAGKHALVEKPMATSAAEADKMIAAARRAGRILAVFHNLRYEQHFHQIRKIIESGKLGRIVEIKLTYHGFIRRWDWQMLQKYGGGMLRNAGSHLLDQLLAITGEMSPRVFCHRESAVTPGDAEDQVKVILRAPGKPLVDLEISHACAYPQEAWLIMGTLGSLTGNSRRLRWKYFDPNQAPARPVDENPTPDRSYNREVLPWVEESWERRTEDRADYDYYIDLFAVIRHGAPLVVAPELARCQMAIIEECYRQSPLPRKFE